MAKSTVLLGGGAVLVLAALVASRSDSTSGTARSAATADASAAATDDLPMPYLPERYSREQFAAIPSVVEAQLFRLRPKFKACYRAAAEHRPGLRGEAVFTVTIGGDGGVTDVVPRADGGLPMDLLGCVTMALRSASFDAPPDGGAASIHVPVSFTPSAKPDAERPDAGP